MRLQTAQRWERSSDLGDDDDESSDFLEEQSRAPPDAAADVHDHFESPVSVNYAFRSMRIHTSLPGQHTVF